VPITFRILAIAIAGLAIALAWVKQAARWIFPNCCSGASPWGRIAYALPRMAAMKMSRRYVTTRCFSPVDPTQSPLAIAALWCAFSCALDLHASAFWKKLAARSSWHCDSPAWHRSGGGGFSRPARELRPRRRLEHTVLAITLGALALLSCCDADDFALDSLHRSPVPPARSRASGAHRRDHMNRGSPRPSPMRQPARCRRSPPTRRGRNAG